eukprot:scaffold5240_cov116-Isochrysis_galbana.AAC.4
MRHQQPSSRQTPRGGTARCVHPREQRAAAGRRGGGGQLRSWGRGCRRTRPRSSTASAATVAAAATAASRAPVVPATTASPRAAAPASTAAARGGLTQPAPPAAGEQRESSARRVADVWSAAPPNAAGSSPVRVAAPVALAPIECRPLCPGPLPTPAAGSAVSKFKPPEFLRGLPTRPSVEFGWGGLPSTLSTPELTLDRPARPDGAPEAGGCSGGGAGLLSLRAGRSAGERGAGRCDPELSGGVRGNCRRGLGCGCLSSACLSVAIGATFCAPGGVRGRDGLRTSAGCRLAAGLAEGGADGSPAARPPSAAPLLSAPPFPSSVLRPSPEAPTATSCPSHRRREARSASCARSISLSLRVLGDGASSSGMVGSSAMSCPRRATPPCSTLRAPHLFGDSTSETAGEASDETESSESDGRSDRRFDLRREMPRTISGSVTELSRA